MDLFLYCIFSLFYIMVIHFAIAVRKEFNLFLMTGIFVLGGILGMYLGAYEVGLVGAVILSLLFW